MEELKQSIKMLAKKYSSSLIKKIVDRKEEMKTDDNSHYLLYRVLGISKGEGQLIDEYQNTGRFLYKYAGSFLEDAATLCFKFKFPAGIKTKIENTIGKSPKKFEIDFLNGNDALEVKWKDATTDGDHIIKEHTRVKVIKELGHKPIRLMFYYPHRKQAIKIQQILKTLYESVEGEYYGGDEAWNFLQNYTGVDLKAILTEIANERTAENGN
ncbi:MAG TPA: ApaLI family restriction endonuclease [Segetibacter sp.]|jgi:hypothetical protein